MGQFEGLLAQIRRQVLEQEKPKLEGKKYKKLAKRSTHSIKEVLTTESVESSWVSEIGVVTIEDDRLALYCKFKNGTTIGYVWAGKAVEDVPDWFQDWSASPSKGKFIWRWIYHQNYVYLT